MVDTGTSSSGGNNPEQSHQRERVERFLAQSGRDAQGYDFSPKLKFPGFEEVIRRLDESRSALKEAPDGAKHFVLLVHQAVQSFELDGKRVKASRILEKAVKILEEELGSSTKELIPLLTEQGRLLLDARRDIAALRTLSRAFQLVGEHWPVSAGTEIVRDMRLEKARVCDFSSKGLLAVGELPKAERIAKEYHRCSSILFGEKAPETALASARIGQVYLAQGRSEAAAELFQKAFDNLGGLSHYHNKVLLSDYVLDYGRACLNITKLKLGSSLVKQAEEMRIQELGDRMVVASEFSINVAKTFFEIRQVHETEKRCSRAFQVMEEEEVYPVTRACWHELRAACSMSRKREAEAFHDLQAALNLREKFGSANSAQLIHTRAELGGVALRLGMYEIAHEQLSQALGTAIQRYGEGAVQLVPILKDLGLLHDKLAHHSSVGDAPKDYKKSANFFQWAVSIAEKESSTAPTFLAALYRYVADAHRMAKGEPQAELHIREKEVATLRPLKVLQKQFATALLEAGETAVLLGGNYDLRGSGYLKEAEDVATRAGITAPDFHKRRTELHALALVRLGEEKSALSEILKLKDTELQQVLGESAGSLETALSRIAKILYKRHFRPTSDEDRRFLGEM